MRRGSALHPAAVLSVAVALVFALAGCGTGSGGSGGGGGGSGAQAAGPPAGGWPQPENGQITTKMCGLLTDADYAKYGHHRLPVVSQKRVDDAPNAVECLYMTSDELDLGLQPTAEAAKVAYAAALKDHKDRLSEDQRPTVLAENVVPGAEESWFDYWTLGSAPSKFTEYQVEARRGALTVGIILSGLKGKSEQNPRVLLSGLAGLVLQRIPNVGKTDTGVTSKVRFTVTGTGRAREIGYNDPTSAKSVTLKNVRLPWHTSRPLVNTGTTSFVLLNLTATAVGPMAAIGCSISVDGQPVIDEAPRIGGFTSCIKSYTPTKLAARRTLRRPERPAGGLPWPLAGRSHTCQPVNALKMPVNSYVLWLTPLHVGERVPFGQPPLSRPTDQKPT